MPGISRLAATYASQIFWLLVFFGFVYFVVGRAMVPRVMATVDDRDRRIAEDLAAAEAARASADTAEEAWRVQANVQRQEAQGLIAQAKARAAKATEDRLAEAGRVVEARLAEAEARIAAAREAALTEIEAIAGEAAGDIAARVAGLKVAPAKAQAAVKEALHG